MPNVETFQMKITTAVSGNCMLTIDIGGATAAWCTVPKGTADLPPAFFFDVTPNASANLLPTFNPRQVFVPSEDPNFVDPPGSPPLIHSLHDEGSLYIPIPDSIVELPDRSYIEYDLNYDLKFLGRGAVTKTDAINPSPILSINIADPAGSWGVYIIAYTVTMTPRPQPQL
jgi:hypothetical protein